MPDDIDEPRPGTSVTGFVSDSESAFNSSAAPSRYTSDVELRQLYKQQQPPLPDNAAEKVKEALDPKQPEAVEKNYTDWAPWEKRFIVFMVSMAAFFSPLSANVYFPIFNTLSDVLKVNGTLINVTVTTYMIFQGLAPMVIAGASDALGRRPAYIVCFVIYIAANIGLSLQTNYAALLVLRMLQSAGSSSTVALANAVVADIATTAERGVYIGWATAGTFLGPSIGPIIGGILAHYLGWRSVFWFLTIFSGAVFIPLLLLFPETCRKLVGDGAVAPPKWNNSFLTIWHLKRRGGPASKAEQGIPEKPPMNIQNPLKVLAIVFEKAVGMLLVCIAITFAAYYAVSSAIPSQFGDIYGFNDIQIALCFIPVGVGSLLAAFTQGWLIDWNYKRHAVRLGYPVIKTKQMDLTNFPIEKARLQVAFPMLLLEAAATICFGWVIDFETNLAGPLVLLFIMGYCACATFNVMSVLVVDVYPEQPAAATAANNLLRCWFGAAATALIIPMIDGMGRGWAITLVGLLVVICSPLLLLLMKHGPQWRKERREREERKKSEKEAKKNANTTAA